jgi:membrane-associated phospholipid phosphatase
MTGMNLVCLNVSRGLDLISRTTRLLHFPSALLALALAVPTPAQAALATARKQEVLQAALATTAPAMPLAVAPEAASWQPAMIKRVDAYMPPPPPVYKSPVFAQEMAEIQDWQKRRTGDDLKAIAYWNEVPVPMRWSEEIRSEIITASMVPPRAARALALVHAAMYDAMLVTWKAKAKYRRALPVQENGSLKPLGGAPGIPSYPSEHAAISMAAATVMAQLFPDHKDSLLTKARLVGETRIAAGAAHRSDVDAGFKIGEAVAKEILAQRQDDGANDPQTKITKVPGKWWVPEPMEPGAGHWRTFLLRSANQFHFKYDLTPDMKNPKFAAMYHEVAAIHDKLTPTEIERAIYWNFDVPAILWNDIARRAALAGIKARKPDAMVIRWSDITRQTLAKNKDLDMPHISRILNVMHLALGDAFIACWYTKYNNMIPRPFMVAPPGKPLQTVVPTPPHPSWPSAHATGSMAAAVVLSQYFPAQKAYFLAQAKEAAMSRLWGGIHYRKDNDDGLKLGALIGKNDVQQAKDKGWFR